VGEPLEEAAEILHEKLEVLPREIGRLYWTQFKILLRVIEEKEQVKEIKKDRLLRGYPNPHLQRFVIRPGYAAYDF
jgi:hypothetical protein